MIIIFNNILKYMEFFFKFKNPTLSTTRKKLFNYTYKLSRSLKSLKKNKKRKRNIKIDKEQWKGKYQILVAKQIVQNYRSGFIS